MKKVISIFVGALGIGVVAYKIFAPNVSAQNAPLKTVEQLDVARYAGLWYEIASNPQSFQTGCRCTTAQYTLMPNGNVAVKNSCRLGFKWASFPISVNLQAQAVPNTGNAQLRVSFGGKTTTGSPNYCVLLLAPDYSYAVVGEPSLRSLWILSRTPQIDETLYNELLVKIREIAYPTKYLRKTAQDC